MHKLSNYGIRVKKIAGLKDFYTNSTQTVRIEGETSTYIPLYSGVSQRES